MRINKTICDRCGQDITGRTYKLMPELQNDLVELARSLGGYEGEGGRDYCEACTKEIMNFAHAGPSGHLFAKEGDRLLKQLEEAAPEPEPPVPAGHRRIDRGKLMALHRAGWKAKEIGEEMHMNPQTVYAVISQEKAKARAKEEEHAAKEG